MSQVLVLLYSARFSLYEAPPTAFFFAANTIHSKYLKHCTLYSVQWEKMAASSDKRKRDLLTEEDISIVLDKEDESNVFCEESDGFLFDTSGEDQRVSRIQAVLCMTANGMNKCLINVAEIANKRCIRSLNKFFFTY
jgi:hypothetical protein